MDYDSRRKAPGELQRRRPWRSHAGERELEEEEDLKRYRAHLPARASQSGRVGTLSEVEPNPLSADRSIRMDGVDSPEAFGNAPHTLATWTVRSEANGRDRFTVPRSERNPEPPRDCGPLDLDPRAHKRATVPRSECIPERSRDCGPLDSNPRAHNTPRREATAGTNWSSGAVGFESNGSQRAVQLVGWTEPSGLSQARARTL